jgi:hypothetical protein
MKFEPELQVHAPEAENNNLCEIDSDGSIKLKGDYNKKALFSDDSDLEK